MYEEFEHMMPVPQLRDKKTKIKRNIFSDTAPRTVSFALFKCTFNQRDVQWADECTKTFKQLPEMPKPVSASQIALKWGCSHVHAKKLIRSDWDWISITKKHFVHNSHMDPFTQIHKACIDANNPLTCFEAVNLLRKYDGLPYEGDITKYMGWSKFQSLRENGILKPLQGLRNRHKIYYVPGTWFKTKRG